MEYQAALRESQDLFLGDADSPAGQSFEPGIDLCEGGRGSENGILRVITIQSVHSAE